MKSTVIKQDEGYLEVNIHSGFSKFDMLKIFGRLALLDPKKSLPDMWVLHDGAMLPFQDMKGIAEVVSKGLPKNPKGSKSAIVVTDEFQRAQVELYIQETNVLNLEMRIFEDTGEAVDWLLSA